MTDNFPPNILVEIEAAAILKKISEWENQRLSKAQVLDNVVNYLKHKAGILDYND